MEAYTTYEFYTGTYYGDTVPNAEVFPKWLARATDKLNGLTFGHITDAALTTYETAISKATCALIDVLYKFDQTEKNATSATSGNIKSMSSGGRSITFGNNDTLYTEAQADNQKKNRIIFDAVKEYLHDTGLLYAGY